MPPARSDEPAKYSFLVPAVLDRKITEVCRRMNLGSQSTLLRQILEENVDRYLAAASGEEPPAGPDSVVVRVELNCQVADGLGMSARDYNLDLAGVIRLALAEQLPEIMRRSREHREALRYALDLERKERGVKEQE